FIFASSVGKNLGDLSVTALTAYGRHQRAEPIRICNPWGSSAFAQAAIIDELNVDTASLCRGAEHLGLQLTGMIPHRLPTHCGIERKDQPHAPTGCSARPKRPDLMEKTINLRPRGGCRNLTRLLARVVS